MNKILRDLLLKSTKCLIVSLLLTPAAAWAQDACWANEKNPNTKKRFEEQDWLLAIEDWQNQQPNEASYVSLGMAWAVYQMEYSTAESLKKDKKKHCYIGCRVSQSVSYDVSVYLAWLKESEDLQDCDIHTIFEPLDRKSTIDGADYGKTTTEAADCFDFCSQYSVKK